jgi:hypothetical protein
MFIYAILPLMLSTNPLKVILIQFPIFCLVVIYLLCIIILSYHCIHTLNTNPMVRQVSLSVGNKQCKYSFLLLKILVLGKLLTYLPM